MMMINDGVTSMTVLYGTIGLHRGKMGEYGKVENEAGLWYRRVTPILLAVSGWLGGQTTILKNEHLFGKNSQTATVVL